MIENTFVIVVIGLFSLLFTILAIYYKLIEERLKNRIDSKISNELDERIKVICSEISDNIDEKINIIKTKIEDDCKNHTVCRIHGNIDEKDVNDIREVIEDWVFKKRIIRSKQLADACKSDYDLK